jgi:hypothetical protein
LIVVLIVEIYDQKKPMIYMGFFDFNGGSGEIRTHGGDKPSPVFKTGAFNRSATLPSPLF